MTLDELLEQFDEVLDSGIKIPGKKTVVDVEKLRAVVDDIRLNIPAEIKQAKGIVADRADIITNAKREADGRTYTSVTPLDFEGRRQELASIIGGASITETTLQSAGEMLKQRQA